MTKPFIYQKVFVLFTIIGSALFANLTIANDVREKLITKAYNCSDLATEAMITRPLLHFELPVDRAPRYDGYGYGFGGSSGIPPVVGQNGVRRGAPQAGGGLFGVPSKQGVGGGGFGGGGGAANAQGGQGAGGQGGGGLGGGGLGNAPAPNTQQQNQSTPEQKSKITYQIRDVTEVKNLIYQMVDPKSWSVHHAKPKMRSVGSILIITQTQKNHDEIQKLLDMVREAKKQ